MERMRETKKAIDAFMECVKRQDADILRELMTCYSKIVWYNQKNDPLLRRRPSTPDQWWRLSGQNERKRGTEAPIGWLTDQINNVMMDEVRARASCMYECVMRYYEMVK